MAKSLHALRYRNIPATLRKIREEAGLTQRELAERLQWAPSLVHKTEVGDRRADIAEFLDWCLACGVDPVEAFRGMVRERRGK